MKRNYFSLVLLAVLAGACQQPANQFYFVFVEEEQGLDPYQTRVMLNDDFMRFDDGEGAADYLIFDRHKKIIYNVNSEQKTVMMLEEKDTQLEPPFALKHEVKTLQTANDAPSIAGITPVHYQYLTNDELCLDVISVDGLMPDALVALRDFQEILASDSKVTFGAIPADLHDPCEISLSTFAPVRHMQHGFPLQEWKPGYKRSLIDYNENYTIPAGSFDLPKDYFYYSVQQFREGRVDMQNRQIIELEKPAADVDTSQNKITAEKTK